MYIRSDRRCKREMTNVAGGSASVRRSVLFPPAESTRETMSIESAPGAESKRIAVPPRVAGAFSMGRTRVEKECIALGLETEQVGNARAFCGSLATSKFRSVASWRHPLIVTGER